MFFLNHGFTPKIVGTDLRLDEHIFHEWVLRVLTGVRNDQRSRRVTVGDKICLIFLDEL